MAGCNFVEEFKKLFCIMTAYYFSLILALLAVEYLGILLAVVADLVSGLRKSRSEGRPCSSRGLRRSVAKLSSYYLALFCLTVVDGIAVAALVTFASLGRQLIPPFPYLTTVGSLSLALIEAKSIAENSPHRTDILSALRLILKGLSGVDLRKLKR